MLDWQTAIEKEIDRRMKTMPVVIPEFINTRRLVLDTSESTQVWASGRVEEGESSIISSSENLSDISRDENFSDEEYVPTTTSKSHDTVSQPQYIPSKLGPSSSNKPLSTVFIPPVGY